MVVLSETCDKCKSMCNAKHFKQNFKNWTSGNDNIDKFIQDTQLSDCYTSNVLEWIPHERFYDIKNIAEMNVYRANWIDGRIDKWDNENQIWERKDQNMFMILKSLDNPNIVEFINEV
jgi:hypothetical protein